MLVVGLEPTRAFAQGLVGPSVYQFRHTSTSWLRTLEILKAKTRDPASAAARAHTMCRECDLMVSIEREGEQLHAGGVQLTVG